MIQSFANQATEDIFNGKNSRAARRILSPHLFRVALRKLEQLDSTERVADLRIPPGNRLEKLRGNRFGQYSIRINQQYRVCFAWTDFGPAVVEVVDYH